MKGILLAGGAGTRLDPMTRVASKQLQPVYDKPMIYYPLATLLEADIREILLISTPQDTPRFEQLLGDGSQWGVSIEYEVQERPEGIAQAFLVGESFIGGGDVTLILGDNVFYGEMGLDRVVNDFVGGAVVFGYPVSDPGHYGVVTVDEHDMAVSIEEKPEAPTSNLAVPGLYLYDHGVVEIAQNLVLSDRGELEITDVNRAYMEKGKLRTIRLGRGIAWLDSGTQDGLLEAANFIATIERRQGYKIACLEEVAYRRGYVGREHMANLVADMPSSTYREYLERVLAEQLPEQ